VSVTGRLLRLFGKIGLPRRGWATAVGFGTAGTRGPKPLEPKDAPRENRAER
jgi:hypothetical protein